MKSLFLFISILFTSLNLKSTENFNFYNQIIAEKIPLYNNKTVQDFFQDQQLSLEHYQEIQRLFYKTFIKKLRKRFQWAESVQKGEESAERIGIPISIAVSTGLLTCIATAANPYYTAIVTAATAIAPSCFQGVSNCFFQRFLTNLNGIYGEYIGPKKAPTTLFEQKVLDYIWQQYQFPLLLLRKQSVTVMATQIIEQLFQNGLNFSPKFEEEFRSFVKEKSFFSPIESTHNLLRYASDANKSSVLGNQDEGTEWVAKAFLTGIHKKPYCCSFYHKAHTALKMFANIRKFEHSCKADCYTIYGAPLKVHEILELQKLDYTSEENMQSYFLSPILQKMTDKIKPLSTIEYTEHENQESTIILEENDLSSPPSLENALTIVVQ